MNHPDRLLDIDISTVSAQLLLTELVGEDYLSSLFYFNATVMSDTPDLPLETLMGQTVTLRIGKLNDEYTLYNGLIYTASQGKDSQTYHLLICPQIRWLADYQESNVYAVKTPMTIPQIVVSVFKEAGIDYTLALTKTYYTLPVCVQYNESPFNFISRLLEQAGIYYYFTHTEAKHTLVLTDKPSPALLAQPVTAMYSSETRSEPHVSSWQNVANPFLSNIKTQVYDFQQPDTLVTDTQKNTNKANGLPDFFSGTFFHYGDTQANATASQLKASDKGQLQGSTLLGQLFNAQSSYHTWQAGTPFSLPNHETASEQGTYYIHAIAHVARDISYTSLHKDNEPAQSYQNHFFAYSITQAFLPQGRYQSQHFAPSHRLLANNPLANPMLAITTPLSAGLHTASVTAPEGKAVYTDKYGRLKVQFDWDSNGQYDENSFAWVRLKQPLASNGFGVQATPRPEQTLLANFNVGDFNQPLLMNTLPNDASQLPFTPDKTPTQSGWLSRSLDPKANQSLPAGHLLQFEDDAEQPSLTLASHRDMALTSTKNLTENITGTRHTAVQEGNFKLSIDGKLIITAQKAVHWVTEQSRVSITDSDIIIEADAIEIKPASGGGWASSAIANSGTTSTASAGNSNAVTGSNSVNGGASGSSTQLAANSNAQPAAANNNYTSSTEQLPYPVLGLNLVEIPIKTIEMTIPGAIVIITLSLTGDVNFQKIGTYSEGTLSIDSYKVSGQGNLSNFFSYLNIENYTPKEMVIGSNITGDFSSTSVELITPNHTKFSASEQAFEKEFNGWKFEGSLGFNIDLNKYDAPPGNASSQQAWYVTDWDWIKNHFGQLTVPEQAGAIVLGVGLGILALPEGAITAIVGLATATVVAN